ncbi:MAG: DUF177 domain-containing protein [Victivallales bacterium]|nr:DUF177 domain-containing protein [Victivallales bacterium]
MICFSIPLLKKQDVVLEGEEPPSFLEVGNSEMIAFNDPVCYRFHAMLVSNGVLVKGSVHTAYDGVCGRCLKKFKGEIRQDNICLFFAELDGIELDVSEEIRAELVVEIPMNCICKASCKGLCRHCGADLNTGKCGCRETGGESSSWSELDKLEF